MSTSNSRHRNDLQRIWGADHENNRRPSPRRGKIHEGFGRHSNLDPGGFSDLDVETLFTRSAEALIIRGEACNPVRVRLQGCGHSGSTPGSGRMSEPPWTSKAKFKFPQAPGGCGIPQPDNVKPPKPGLNPKTDLYNPHPPLSMALGPAAAPFCTKGDQTAPMRFQSFANDYIKYMVAGWMPYSVLSNLYLDEYNFLALDRITIDGKGTWYDWHSVTASTQLAAAGMTPSAMYASTVCTACVGETAWMAASGFAWEDPKQFSIFEEEVIEEGNFAATFLRYAPVDFLGPLAGVYVEQVYQGWIDPGLYQRTDSFNAFFQGEGGQHRFSVCFVPFVPIIYRDNRSWMELYYSNNRPDWLPPPPPYPLNVWDYK